MSKRNYQIMSRFDRDGNNIDDYPKRTRNLNMNVIDRIHNEDEPNSVGEDVVDIETNKKKKNLPDSPFIMLQNTNLANLL